MESVRDFFTKGPLGKIALILIIAAAGYMGWHGYKAAGDNGGFKPAPIQTPAQQTADIENTIKQVESNSTMPASQKQMVIAMLRSKEPTKSASAKPAPLANQ